MQIRKIKLSRWAQLSPKLFGYLDRLQIGQAEVFRTPFWNKAPMPGIVKKWMSKLINSNIERRMPGLLAVEVEQSKKVGPYSVIPPLSKRMDSLKSYWEPVERQDAINKSALQAVVNLFGDTKLRLFTREQVLAEMRMNTQAGLPYWMPRRDALKIYERTNWNDAYPYMAVGGTRVQAGGPKVEDEKVRWVFMMPMSLNVKEAKYYYPLIKYMQDHDLPFPVNDLRWTEKRITALFESKPKQDLVINTDFKSFDQTFRRPMQDGAHAILSAVFADQDANEIDDTFWVKYRIPLLIAEDKAVFGDHGMGSGSTGTNPDENLAHKALQYEVALEHGQVLNPNSMALGDDGILTYPGVTVNEVVSSYTRHGLVMNEQKQYASRNSARYLQRYYHESYRDKEGVMLGVYPTVRALGRLLAQERFHDPKYWGPKQVTLRALSIIENCKNHPLFERFVDFVRGGDSYDLGLKIPGFFSHLEQDWEEYKEHHGLESYTARNEKTSILQWAVVKYLMTKA